MNQAEVLIAGAGIAGASAALRDEGVAAAMLDPRRLRSSGPR